MKYLRGALTGAVIMLFFYAFLTGITPNKEHSVIPTGYVTSSEQGFESYLAHLPQSMMVFISLEIVGLILGAVGHRIISHAQTSE